LVLTKLHKSTWRVMKVHQRLCTIVVVVLSLSFPAQV
jgi:hypothetical protein